MSADNGEFYQADQNDPTTPECCQSMSKHQTSDNRSVVVILIIAPIPNGNDRINYLAREIQYIRDA
jgi:hypothetical protein